MMQSTNLWERDHLASSGSVYGPGIRSFLVRADEVIE
jgi:hypothetical protein